MKALTININEKSKKGKAFLDFIQALYTEEGDVQLIEINDVAIKNSSESNLNLVAENAAKYKTARKSKKETKNNSESEDASSPYNPEFVKMVLEAAKSKKRTVIDPNDIWGSLGLK